MRFAAEASLERVAPAAALPELNVVGMERRGAAQLDAHAHASVAARQQGICFELAARIKGAHIRGHFVARNAQLTQEVLDLKRRQDTLAPGHTTGRGSQHHVMLAQMCRVNTHTWPNWLRRFAPWGANL